MPVLNLDFDPDSLTLGELESLEIEFGIKLGDVLAFYASAGASSSTVLTGLVWVAGRRLDPTFTVADARAARFVDIQWASESADGG